MTIRAPQPLIQRLTPRQVNAFRAPCKHCSRPSWRRNLSNTSAKRSLPPLPESKTQNDRAGRILSKLPKSLQKYASRLRGAPVTHVVAFLILHEITAVVPLLGLFGLFHYNEEFTKVPMRYMLQSSYAGYVRDGVGRFERYFKRKGWFGFSSDQSQMQEGGAAAATDMVEGLEQRGEEARDGKSALSEGQKRRIVERWETDERYRIVVEVGLAYALTKALLPARIVVSVWGTPWFAGVLSGFKRLVSRKR
ncbi:hypothetical protein QBC35DRAFT_375489 [Podospora australis]|uniref:Uncharacterized protein n=1 Tax=Podospora australis TaxID=1536484 RepID=A0AAN6X1V9_9PEZI|nr:hypothetical protein QBC35DRAFT_375489 [Podospora australis]